VNSNKGCAFGGPTAPTTTACDMVTAGEDLAAVACLLKNVRNQQVKKLVTLSALVPKHQLMAAENANLLSIQCIQTSANIDLRWKTLRLKDQMKHLNVSMISLLLAEDRRSRNYAENWLVNTYT